MSTQVEQTQRHVGAGMDLIPELLIRQIIIEGLVELAGDPFRQEELFSACLL